MVGLATALGLIASLPVLVAGIHALVVRWYPISDYGYTAVSALDVLSSHPPLVGQWSSGASDAVGRTVYSPGPMLFWVLAAPARLMDPATMPLTMGLVNAASIVGAVILALRRGGLWLMVATAVAVPAMLGSVPADVYASVWNSSAVFAPFTLLIFLCWSVADGETWLLPIAVLVASFVAQTHLSFVIPALLLLLVAVLALVLRTPHAEGRTALRRALLLTAAVLVVCWALPVVDQLTHHPGNLRLIADAATTGKPKLGYSSGLRGLEHAIGVLPGWLRAPREPLARIADLTRAASLVTTIGAGAILVILLGGLWRGWRRGEPRIVVAAAVGLALCLALVQDVASIPSNPASLLTVGYTLRWASAAGMAVWLLAGVVLARSLAGRGRVPLQGTRWLVPAVSLAVLVVFGLSVRQTLDSHVNSAPFRAMRTVAPLIEHALRGNHTVAVAVAPGSNFLVLQFAAGTVFALRHEGHAVVVPVLRKGMGERYAHGRATATVELDVGSPHPTPGRELARTTVFDPDTKLMHTLVVRLEVVP